ncbi:MAG: DUF6128 domain-containing protein [Eubacteriales bacterium]|nr:DUF6128 domain-containing protein [Eubacteriales bacterium]
MADYQRFVSYIYSYPGGVKDKNVGFAKAELRSGEFKLSINLRGVYTDTPEIFNVYFLVDRDDSVQGRYYLLPVGECLVKGGMALYQGLFNGGNIDGTDYSFDDICGIGIAREDDKFYMMFSMWEDNDINPDAVVIGKKGHKKNMAQSDSRENTESGCDGQQETDHGNQEEIELDNQYERALNEEPENMNSPEKTENVVDKSVLAAESKQEDKPEYKSDSESEKEKKIFRSIYQEEITEQFVKNRLCEKKEEKIISPYEMLFMEADFIDAFDDDYFYDCIEISPEMLLKKTDIDRDIINNSFLIHGFYNFRHLLFGRVRDNGNNTKYFLGVPGMYCNRERYMASMFGFNNFKKSHRSDYTNPYFGYWYQEL